jgi:hypothetical protein
MPKNLNTTILRVFLALSALACARIEAQQGYGRNEYTGRAMSNMRADIREFSRGISDLKSKIDSMLNKSNQVPNRAPEIRARSQYYGNNQRNRSQSFDPSRERVEEENRLRQLMLQESFRNQLVDRPFTNDTPTEYKAKTRSAYSNTGQSSWGRPQVAGGSRNTPQIGKKDGATPLTSKRGKYYVLPFAGALFPTKMKYETENALGTARLSGDKGFTFGVTGGRRFGNFTGGLSLGLSHYLFNSLEAPPPWPAVSTAGKGESYLINLSGRLGYSVTLSEDLWLQFGGGLGLGYRAEGGGFYFRTTPVPLKTSKTAAFSYEAFTKLGYGFTEHLQATIGYRYLGAGKHGNFGTYGAHSVELGLGGNF